MVVILDFVIGSMTQMREIISQLIVIKKHNIPSVDPMLILPAVHRQCSCVFESNDLIIHCSQ